jgi:hypothetical protein
MFKLISTLYINIKKRQRIYSYNIDIIILLIIFMNNIRTTLKYSP